MIQANRHQESALLTALKILRKETEFLSKEIYKEATKLNQNETQMRNRFEDLMKPDLATL